MGISYWKKMKVSRVSGLVELVSHFSSAEILVDDNDEVCTINFRNKLLIMVKATIIQRYHYIMLVFKVGFHANR